MYANEFKTKEKQKLTATYTCKKHMNLPQRVEVKTSFGVGIIMSILKL